MSPIQVGKTPSFGGINLAQLNAQSIFGQTDAAGVASNNPFKRQVNLPLTQLLGGISAGGHQAARDRAYSTSSGFNAAAHTGHS